MGYYLRKTISVGPLRFNLSKSGIGVSAGIKGLRFGSGPRGNYVHIGMGGLYYKKTLPITSNSFTRREIVPEKIIETSHESLKEIESGDITKMFDSSSEELIKEINEKKQLIRMMPAVAIFGCAISLFLLLVIESKISFIVFLLLTGFSSYLASLKDDLRKSTILFYELEPEIESLYQQLHDAFDAIANISKVWHVEAEGAVHDKKRHAGASSLIKRNEIKLAKNNPPFVKTNISTPCIPVGKQVMYFFPDKILVFEGNEVGAVSYNNLKLLIEKTKFIEDGSVPSDTKIVDKTWQYVNKSGGPDKRFNNNKEMPIVLYEDIAFQSSTGLNERIQLSKTEIGNTFKIAIEKLSE